MSRLPFLLAAAALVLAALAGRRDAAGRRRLGLATFGPLALTGPLALALGLRAEAPGSPGAALGLLALALLLPGLVLEALPLRRVVPSAAPGFLAAAATSLGAWAALPQAAVASPRLGWLASLLVGAGLAAAFLLLELQSGDAPQSATGRSAALPAAAALLALAALPGLGWATLGSGFGLLPADGARALLLPAFAGPQPAGILQPQVAHLLPLRLPLPWASALLALAALGFGGALATGLWPGRDPAQPWPWPQRGLLLGGGALLVLLALILALPLLPLALFGATPPEPLWLQDPWLVHLPRGWRLEVPPLPAGPLAVSGQGASLDLMLLCGSAAGALWTWGTARTERPRGAAAGPWIELALASLALAAAAAYALAQGSTAAPWFHEPRAAGLAATLVVAALARWRLRSARPGGRWLLLLSLVLLLTFLLGAGRGGSAAPALDTLTLV